VFIECILVFLQRLLYSVEVVMLQLYRRIYGPSKNSSESFNSKPCGPRKIGRPKLRWEDGVLQDIGALGIRNWRDMVMRGEEWQILMWWAKARPELSSLY
jgi:hypothetical protein